MTVAQIVSESASSAMAMIGVAALAVLVVGGAFVAFIAIDKASQW